MKLLLAIGLVLGSLSTAYSCPDTAINQGNRNTDPCKEYQCENGELKLDANGQTIKINK